MPVGQRCPICHFVNNGLLKRHWNTTTPERNTRLDPCVLRQQDAVANSKEQILKTGKYNAKRRSRTYANCMKLIFTTKNQLNSCHDSVSGGNHGRPTRGQEGSLAPGAEREWGMEVGGGAHVPPPPHSFPFPNICLPRLWRSRHAGFSVQPETRQPALLTRVPSPDGGAFYSLLGEMVGGLAVRTRPVKEYGIKLARAGLWPHTAP